MKICRFLVYTIFKIELPSRKKFIPLIIIVYVILSHADEVFE